ncbi:DUF3616 domain-containing protein [Marinivivus vitaminiproducens]|uniref:DUF3616 domain-containing protein n=1 Tax=Marinivivus vitaminiproducens TaxID=3035935 RepID=UPI00279ADE2A|nr:DUF3616 domain-containing protein [Geminicoccaceae bacterium SCSIO 64248]
MAIAVDRVQAKVSLTFQDMSRFAHIDDPLHEDLSGMARIGRSLFLACDETASVERLEQLEGGRWGRHTHIALDPIFDLPAGPDGEMDIEGLAIDDGFLWIVGSHAHKRKKPKRAKNTAAEALERMEDVEREANRYFLGRVPLKETEPGLFEPVAEHNGRRADTLKLKKTSSRLVSWLRKDRHLAPFLDLPSKENGLDVEGIAVRRDRVWLGLRGPVLLGHAVILEIRLDDTHRHLKAKRIEGKRRYRKHLIDSAGLGVRDLRFLGGDLLILLGPAMSADGPARILRWRNAVRTPGSGVVDGGRLDHVLELPYRGAYEHPEGIELWPEAGEESVLVVYDAPAPERFGEGGLAMTADVFDLADRPDPA